MSKRLLSQRKGITMLGHRWLGPQAEIESVKLPHSAGHQKVRTAVTMPRSQYKCQIYRYVLPTICSHKHKADERWEALRARLPLLSKFACSHVRKFASSQVRVPIMWGGGSGRMRFDHPPTNPTFTHFQLDNIRYLGAVIRMYRWI